MSARIFSVISNTWARLMEQFKSRLDWEWFHWGPK